MTDKLKSFREEKREYMCNESLEDNLSSIDTSIFRNHHEKRHPMSH